MAGAASLDRMTVPAGADTGTGGAILMPKLQYRFRVLFENMGVNDSTAELTKQVVEATRPTLTFPEIPLNVYNSRIYLAGKGEWNAISITVRDDATGTVTGIVGRQIQKQMDFGEQASAAAGIDYKFKTVIQILDGGNGTFTPNVLETWELYGCFIQSVNYQTLNYGSNEPVTIQMSLRYDNALQSMLDTVGGIQLGIGESVGRTLGDVVTGIGQ